MSDQQESSSAKERATVALVYRTVDDLGKLTQANFDALNARLDAVARLPEQVNGLHERVVVGETRITRLEETDTQQLSTTEQRKLYRKTSLPALVIATLAFVASVAMPYIHG